MTLAIAAGALAGRFDADTSTPPRSPTTESPSPSPSPNPQPKRQVRVLLDMVELVDGRRVALRAWGPAWGLTSKEDGGPCLRITGIDELFRQCGRAPSELVPRSRAAISGPLAVQRNASAPLEVYGATSEEVSRVVVRYSSDAQRRQTQAHLLRCDDPQLLEEAGISEPFGYFFAELPNDTSGRTVRAIAFGATGERLGSTGFSTYPVEGFINVPPRR